MTEICVVAGSNSLVECESEHLACSFAEPLGLTGKSWNLPVSLDEMLAFDVHPDYSGSFARA